MVRHSVVRRSVKLAIVINKLKGPIPGSGGIAPCCVSDQPRPVPTGRVALPEQAACGTDFESNILKGLKELRLVPLD